MLEPLETHYRLIVNHNLWKRYSVLENGERFLVTRFQLDINPEERLSVAEWLEEFVQHLNMFSESTSYVPKIQRLVPHGNGFDLFTSMPVGTTLKALVQQHGPLPMPVVASISNALSTSLQNAFEKGIHHHCLHPERILVDDQFNLTILDFGLVQILEKFHGSIRFPTQAWNSLYPSPSFVAPERMRGEATGLFEDIFTLSSLAFFMISGVTAYVGADDLEIYSQVRSGNRPQIDEMVEHCSPRISREIYRGLSPHYIDRLSRPSDWVQESFGASESLDSLVDALSRVKSALNDWYYDAYFKTVQEPSRLDPMIALLMENKGHPQQSPPLEAVFQTMRSSRENRKKSGTTVFYFSLLAIVFGILGLTVLYFFVRA